MQFEKEYISQKNLLPKMYFVGHVYKMCPPHNSTLIPHRDIRLHQTQLSFTLECVGMLELFNKFLGTVAEKSYYENFPVLLVE